MLGIIGTIVVSLCAGYIISFFRCSETISLQWAMLLVCLFPMLCAGYEVHELVQLNLELHLELVARMLCFGYAALVFLGAVVQRYTSREQRPG